MVDQIQEQIPASDHVEATGTALRRVSWDRIIPAGIALGLAILIATGAILFLVLAGVWSNTAAPATQEQIDTAPAVSRAPVPESQTAPAPVTKEWPKVEVRWSEPFLINSLADLPPSLPAGKGFYRETPEGIGSAGSSDEAFAFAQKILGIATPYNLTPVIAGVARDPAYPNIVFAGVMVSYKEDQQGYLFLSVDGEKTWTEISRIYPARRWETHLDVRAIVEGNTVTLFARDPDFVAPMWRKATLSLKGLP